MRDYRLAGSSSAQGRAAPESGCKLGRNIVLLRQSDDNSTYNADINFKSRHN